MNAQRFGTVVLGALGSIAVLLTLLGMYVLAESPRARHCVPPGSISRRS